MTLNHQKTSQKVVPFTGEFYQTEHQDAAKPPITILIMLGLCLICGGAAIGATAVYNSPEQKELRMLQEQSEQLQQLKKQLCN